ncbi:hypothetical protein WDU99_03635 [Microbacterium sp. Mu-80]|uniref:Secreted protein n=1 Tax=Microbacterium bandirmense TaxID=3122050 RepID=A0ABU8L8M3_9MICO
MLAYSSIILAVVEAVARSSRARRRSMCVFCQASQMLFDRPFEEDAQGPGSEDRHSQKDHDPPQSDGSVLDGVKKNATPNCRTEHSLMMPGSGTTFRTWKKQVASATHHRKLVSEPSRYVRAFVTVALTIGSPF